MAPGDSPMPLRERLAEWIAHLTHVLPAQAPIRDFVHHNTLHGFQHLPFAEALAAAQQLSGATPYWPENQFRREFATGRINREDLSAALSEVAIVGLDEVLVHGLTRQDVLLASLLAPETLTAQSRQDWQAQEFKPADAAVLAECARLTATVSVSDESWRSFAAARCVELFARVGEAWTLRSLLQHLSGEDVLERVRSVLQLHLAAHLDLGMGAWPNPAQSRGFYAAWRASAGCDLGWDIDDLPNVRDEIADLPENALDALLAALTELLSDERLWPLYLERLCLELPGWSGMFLWRDGHPARVPPESRATPVAMLDFLTVRVLLEHFLTADLIQRLTGSLLNVAQLEAYFQAHPAEFYVRDAVQGGVLPEDLLHRAAHFLNDLEGERRPATEWEALAEAIQAQVARPEYAQEASRLADLAQQLGLSSAALQTFSPAEARALLAVDAELSGLARGHVWLLAYERHYREEIFTALCCCKQAHPQQRSGAASAQVVFCMDDREEGTRRHLEEIAPSVATYGAAGFFGVAMYWQGMDDSAKTALCPVVVQPQHLVQEVAASEGFAAAVRHAGRRAWRLQWRERFYQGTRRAALFGPLLTALAALPALCSLLALSLAPAGFGRMCQRWRQQFEGVLPSHLLFSDEEALPLAADVLRHGFTTVEQVDRVEDFLRTIGLTEDFSPLVLMFGHGSGSQNNPHLSAYDCGACSGRHGGPNARVFAAMANQPAVRAGLAERGLAIPANCWFVAAEHNTCDDSIHWYDLEQVPAEFQQGLDRLLSQLAEACRAHAVERCRRLASAPLGLTPWQGEQHVRGRLHDISQARPELGHANNATALLGRRAMSQGLFLDRRAFLISYDPLTDATGSILENLLLAVGPVGAGINLEYYFSTVDNQRFGCGSKVTHNITGLFGVMDGADSDLRTGLPWQMVEIHEPMRLLLVVEQTTELLTALLRGQPALHELIQNAWIILAAQDPSTAAIERYCPRRGWLPWSGSAVLPQVARSHDWFAGESGALAPALLLGGRA